MAISTLFIIIIKLIINKFSILPKTEETIRLDTDGHAIDTDGGDGNIEHLSDIDKKDGAEINTEENQEKADDDEKPKEDEDEKPKEDDGDDDKPKEDDGEEKPEEEDEDN